MTYQPAAGYCNDLGGAPDTFTYTLNGGSTATVAVTVQCVTVIPPVFNPPVGPGHPRRPRHRRLRLRAPASAPARRSSPSVLQGTTCWSGHRPRRAERPRRRRLPVRARERRPAHRRNRCGPPRRRARRDRINGDAGDDKIRAGSGNDDITPGTGNDTVAAQGGDDTISARDNARDTIDCGARRRQGHRRPHRRRQELRVREAGEAEGLARRRCRFDQLLGAGSRPRRPPRRRGP